MIGHCLFFHHGGIDSDTQAVAQKSSQSPEGNEDERETEEPEGRGFIIPSWFIIIILSDSSERMYYCFCKC